MRRGEICSAPKACDNSGVKYTTFSIGLIKTYTANAQIHTNPLIEFVPATLVAAAFLLSLLSPSISFPSCIMFLSPLIHLAPLPLRVCCDKAKPAAGEPLLCQGRRDCHWSAVFDYPLRCPGFFARWTLLLSFPLRALRLKIASPLASTPSAANIWNVPRPPSARPGGIPFAEVCFNLSRLVLACSLSGKYMKTTLNSAGSSYVKPAETCHVIYSNLHQHVVLWSSVYARLELIDHGKI